MLGGNDMGILHIIHAYKGFVSACPGEAPGPVPVWENRTDETEDRLE